MSKRLALNVLLIVLAVTAYWNALDNPLVFDDVVAISDNLFVQSPRLAWMSLLGAPSSEGFAQGQFRPLPMLSFSLNHLLTGDSPRGYRITNLALHIVVCLLTAAVLRRILMTFPLRRRVLDEQEATWAAFLAATLLAVHPIHSLAVLLVWKRATLLAAAFSLLAVWCLLRLRGMGEPQEGRRPPRSTLLTVTIYLAQLLALSSKETAIVLPAGLLLIDLWPRLGSLSRRALAAFHAPLWALAAIFVAFVYPHGSHASLSPLSYLATQTKVVWMYAAMVVAPNLLSASYSVEVPSGMDPLVIAGGLGIIVVLFGAAKLIKVAPLASLAAFWMAIALLPTSSLLPIPYLVDEDRVYLASVLPWGLLGALAIIAMRTGRKWTRIAVQAAAVTLVGVLVLLIAARGALWSTPTLVWLDAHARYPRSPHAATNLCVALGTDPSPDERKRGLAACREAVQALPPGYLANLAREMFVELLTLFGRVDDARAVLAEGLKQDPESAELLRVAGHLAWTEGKPTEAIAYYERALRKLPLNTMVAIYLGSSYAKAGRAQDAVHMARQLLQWPLPEDPALLIPLLDLFHTVGWDDRACAGYARVRIMTQASAELRTAARGLEATCRL